VEITANNMTNKKLIELAASVVSFNKIDDFTSGSVGCAMISEKDNIFYWCMY